MAMLEESVLKILPLSKCISRVQELAQAKVDKQIVVIENQQLQIKPENLSTELRVHNAMIRRGLAMDQAGWMSFHVHDKIMREFLGHLTRQQPVGCRGPDIQSILQADQELWVRCSETCRSELRVRADGKLPLDEAAEEHYMSAPILFHLLPLPSGKGSNSGSQPRKKEKKEKKVKKDTKRTKLPETLKGFSGVNKSKKDLLQLKPGAWMHVGHYNRQGPDKMPTWCSPMYQVPWLPQPNCMQSQLTK